MTDLIAHLEALVTSAIDITVGEPAAATLVEHSVIDALVNACHQATDRAIELFDVLGQLEDRLDDALAGVADDLAKRAAAYRAATQKWQANAPAMPRVITAFVARELLRSTRRACLGVVANARYFALRRSGDRCDCIARIDAGITFDRPSGPLELVDSFAISSLAMTSLSTCQACGTLWREEEAQDDSGSWSTWWAVSTHTAPPSSSGTVGPTRRWPDGDFACAYNRLTRTLVFERAFMRQHGASDGLPNVVPKQGNAPELVPDRGTPTLLYITLYQMKRLGVSPGYAPGRPGVETVIMSNVQNLDTIVHLHYLRDQLGGEPSALIHHTKSVDYAESTIVQLGYERVGQPTVTVRSESSIRPICQLQAGNNPWRIAEHDRLLARYGYDRDTPMYWGFDIAFPVRPLVVPAFPQTE